MACRSVRLASRGASAAPWRETVREGGSASSCASSSWRADGVLHFGERAALVEQLSYLKRRNAKLSRQQRAVLLAACEAQAAHARCADFAGELLSKSGDDEDLGRLAQENAELKRKTAALADYVRRTAPAEEGHVDSDTTSSDSENDDDDDVLPPPPNDDVRPSCLGDDDRRRCEWSAFVAGVVGAFGARDDDGVID